MTFYRVNRRYYTRKDGTETSEFYVMPYDLKGTIEAVGIWPVFLDFWHRMAYFNENKANKMKTYLNGK